jgi:hypothetical protein
VVAAGGSVSSGRRTLLLTLINNLKAAGVWKKLDRLWIFAAENSQSALIDLVALDQASAVNSPTFTTDRGYAGNGSTSYIDTTYNAYTQGSNFVAASKHIGIWDNTSRGYAVNVGTGVYTDTSNDNSLFLYNYAFTPNGFGYRLGDSFRSGAYAVPSSQGFFIAQTNAYESWPAYYNGASLGTFLSGWGSTIVNVSFFVGGQNGNGTLINPTSDQFSMVSYGGGLTPPEAHFFYTHLRTYMTAVGVP